MTTGDITDSIQTSHGELEQEALIMNEFVKTRYRQVLSKKLNILLQVTTNVILSNSECDNIQVSLTRVLRERRELLESIINMPQDIIGARQAKYNQNRAQDEVDKKMAELGAINPQDFM